MVQAAFAVKETSNVGPRHFSHQILVLEYVQSTGDRPTPSFYIHDVTRLSVTHRAMNVAGLPITRNPARLRARLRLT